VFFGGAWQAKATNDLRPGGKYLIEMSNDGSLRSARTYLKSLCQKIVFHLGIV